MKKALTHIISTILIFSSLLISCNSNNNSTAEKEAQSQKETFTEEESKKLSYEQISPEKAKELMDTEENYIILDVRTQEEFAESHIKNAILIPDFEIKEKAEGVLTDKDQLILVYCRSGRRSKNAAKALIELGYVNVKEFGGIIDWPYGTVKD